MKIKVLGTRGEIESSGPYHSHQSGVLLDECILFDCGDQGFLKEEPECIFITHLHPDHAFFVRDPKKKYSIKPPVFAPEEFEGAVDVVVITEAQQFGEYHITPIPTHHSHKVESQAYLIQKNKEKILYTGDMIWINKEHHHLLSDLDLVITEASFIRKGGMIRRHEESKELYGHTGVPDLLRLFNRFTTHILFVHYGNWFYDDVQESRKKLHALGKEHQVNVLVGYDGMTLDTSELSGPS